MLKRSWALIALIYLALAEALSLVPVPDLSLCLVQPENGEQATNYDGNKYCPAFHVGVIASLDAVDGFLERHDKSVVGGFTVILAISTIGLWLATNKLWAAGEKQFGLLSESAVSQSRDMQDSIAGAIRAATAMENVASTIQGNAAVQLRAYVSVLSGSMIEQTEETQFECQPAILNAGFTPAYNVVVYSKVAVLPFPLPIDFDFSLPEGPEPSVGVLGFQQSTFTVAALDRRLPSEDIAEIKRPGGRRLYHYGHVTYRDFLGRTHRTNFCFYTIWGAKAPVAMITNRNNDAT